MNKPYDYDNTPAFSDFEIIELGGHILEIKKVEETNYNGSDMIIITLDTAKEDKQPDFYRKKYLADTRVEKKWGCQMRIWVTDMDGRTSRAFKTFITCVEKSNNGFSVAWGDGFCDYFKGKKIGGVFGEEEFLSNTGEVKKAIKCRWFRSVEEVKNGVEVPEIKKLKNAPVNTAPAKDYEDLSGDEDLPF